METNAALSTLTALSQETRLRVFRLLVEFGDSGTSAGQISEELDVPHNTLSFHLSHLSHAGLVFSRKQGRSVIYTANRAAMDELLDYLKANCCIREDAKSLACSSDQLKQQGTS